MKLFSHYNIQNIIGIPNNPIGQTVIEMSNWTIKDMLNKYKWVENTFRNVGEDQPITLLEGQDPIRLIFTYKFCECAPRFPSVFLLSSETLVL